MKLFGCFPTRNWNVAKQLGKLGIYNRSAIFSKRIIRHHLNPGATSIIQRQTKSRNNSLATHQFQTKYGILPMELTYQLRPTYDNEGDSSSLYGIPPYDLKGGRSRRAGFFLRGPRNWRSLKDKRTNLLPLLFIRSTGS